MENRMNKLFFCLPLLAIVLAGCPHFGHWCDDGFCDPKDDGGTDGAAEGSPSDATTDRDPPPPGCTTPENPLQNPEKCLVDAFGAFVSPTGDDANDGTKAKPFKTIGKALASGKTRVVVCEGTYAEALDIGRDVEIYGGVACSFDKAGPTPVLDSGKALGLSVSRGNVRLANLALVAKDATEAGESSIGVAVAAGAALTMVGGAVSAGAGAAGTEGTTASNYSALAQSDSKIKGNDGSGNMGGAAQTCAMLGCVENVGVANTGGSGGVGAAGGGSPGTNGATSVPGAPAGRGNGGSYDVGLATCGVGIPGADASGANGGVGATTPGSIEGGKWTATRGTTGTTARPGQAGGGGSGGRDQGAMNAGGGGGGCGGCGGGKGLGGQSGGSSFAVLSMSATVSLENVTLKTATGGKGGKGGDGQIGQLGGLSGAAAASGIGCPGGLGGQGGQGGGGGGGAGGHSVAVAYTGTKPTLKSITPDVAGTAAAGGEPGASAPTVTQATSGAPGKTGADLAL